jgi:NADPH-dependent curcumin reductase CurA
MTRIPEALEELLEGYKSGSLKSREHVMTGIESFPEAFDMLFSGDNQGKLLIKIS